MNQSDLNSFVCSVHPKPAEYPNEGMVPMLIINSSIDTIKFAYNGFTLCGESLNFAKVT